MPITSVKYFNPKQISGCSLWLDSADPATTGGGGNVSTWLDKSGNGNTATNQGSAGTITSTAAGLVFNGSGYMYIPGIAGSLVNKPFVIFIVETLNTTSGAIILGDDSSANYGTDNVLHIIYRNTSDLAFGFYGDDLEDTVISGTGNKRLWAFYLPLASNRVTRRNGAVDVTHGNYNRLNYFTTPSIGRSFGGYLYVGTISEIIIYPSDIGLTAIQQTEGYLAQKWGITLATGHPGLTQTFYAKQNSALTLTNTPYYTTFSPKTAGTCALWLDAADSSTITGSSPITAWTDKSGNNNTVSIVSGPTYGTTKQNGKNTLYFNGNSITTTIPTAVGTGDFTLIAVWYQYSAGTNTVLSLGTSASSSQGLGFSGNKYNFYQYGDANESDYSTSTPSWIIQVGTRISSVKKLYINGTAGTTPASTSYDVSVKNVTIGNGDTFSITGQIGEIMIFTGTMDATNRQKIESYLAQKWGLESSLPSDHLDRSFPVGSPVIIQPYTSGIKKLLTYQGPPPSPVGSVSIASLTTTNAIFTWSSASLATGYNFYIINPSGTITLVASNQSYSSGATTITFTSTLTYVSGNWKGSVQSINLYGSSVAVLTGTTTMAVPFPGALNAITTNSITPFIVRDTRRQGSGYYWTFVIFLNDGSCAELRTDYNDANSYVSVPDNGNMASSGDTDEYGNALFYWYEPGHDYDNDYVHYCRDLGFYTITNTSAFIAGTKTASPSVSIQLGNGTYLKNSKYGLSSDNGYYL